METFADILAAWRKAARESDKRALWRTLARGGWLQACRTAVQQHDRVTLTSWLDETQTTQQEILQFSGPHAAQTVYTHLACSLAACERNADTDGEILPVPPLTKEGTQKLPFVKGGVRSKEGTLFALSSEEQP